MDTLRKRLLAATLAALAVAGPASAEDVTVSGTVRDPSGRPIAGATVAVKSGPSARTDGNGFYTLKLPAGTHTLRATHARYEAAALAVTLTATAEAADLVLS